MSMRTALNSAAGVANPTGPRLGRLRNRISTSLPALPTTQSLGTTPTAAVLLFSAIVFQHFQIASLGGYPLTLGAVVGFLLLTRIARGYDWRLFVVILSVVVLWSSLATMLDPLHTNAVQYLRTLALIGATLAFVCAGAFGRDKATSNRIPLVWTLRAAFGVITLMAVCQVVAGYFGSDALFNPWGSYQYLYPYAPWVQAGTFPRAQAFYLEPSYAALTLCLLTALLLYLDARSVAILMTGGVGLATTQSASGLVAFGLMVTTWGLTRRGRGLLASLIVLALLGFALGDYVTSRLESTLDSSSSAYYRLVAPMPLIREVLQSYPLGRPLGSIDSVTVEASLRNGTEAGVTIDNGYLLILFYFGWGGLLLLTCLLILVAVKITHAVALLDRRISILIWLLMCPMFNGGIFLPEFAMMFWLATATYRYGPAFEEGSS